MNGETSTRFRKGQSGNPKGRPKKKVQPAPAWSAFDSILQKSLPVMQNGIEQNLTAEEALQLRTYQEALKGSRPAIGTILKMIEKRELWFADQPVPSPPRVVTYQVEMDPDNANEALLLLGIAVRKGMVDGSHAEDEHLLLEPWAVQAALKRARGLKLKSSDYTMFTNSIRKSEGFPWHE